MIYKFIKNFTEKDILFAAKIGKKYFLSTKEMDEAVRKTGVVPDSVGVFLGEEKKGKFYASVALIDIISKNSNKKIFIDSKSEWLFLCGRDIMAGSIVKADADSGFVLVQNEKDENLGFGRVVENLRNSPKRIVVMNTLDKGDFLRREMD